MHKVGNLLRNAVTALALPGLLGYMGWKDYDRSRRAYDKAYGAAMGQEDLAAKEKEQRMKRKATPPSYPVSQFGNVLGRKN